MLHFRFISPTLAALGTAVFFGASTPFAKQLVGQISPLLLAGLLYAGSGIGLMLIRLIKDGGWHHDPLRLLVGQNSKNQKFVMDKIFHPLVVILVLISCLQLKLTIIS